MKGTSEETTTGVHRLIEQNAQWQVAFACRSTSMYRVVYQGQVLMNK